MRVKICGITSPEDARLAVEAGADAIGIIAVPSSVRYVPPQDAHEIYAEAGPYVPVVVVAVRPEDALQYEHDVVQFYEGSVSKGARAVRVFRIKDGTSLVAVAQYDGPPGAIHLDTYHEKALGGVGEQFDWSLAVAAKGLQPSRPLILAGGLSPENVAEAVRVVQPYAVDVSSGVERAPGKKDPQKVRDFIQAAKGTRCA